VHHHRVCRFQKTDALNVRSRLHYSSGGVGSIRQRRAAAGHKPSFGPQVEQPTERRLQLECCHSARTLSEASNFQWLPSQSHGDSSASSFARLQRFLTVQIPPLTQLPTPWATPAVTAAATKALIAVAPHAELLRPLPHLIFRAFELIPPQDVRVVIFGLDPFPRLGHAMGLAFSVPESTVPLPSTLKNIYKEFKTDLGRTLRSSDLTHWAKQGVLLANVALTMAGGKAGEHVTHWQPFAKAWVRHLQGLDQPCVWILWGNDPKALKTLITSRNHRLIESPHPSPRSAWRGFFGSRPFSRANEILIQMGCKPIDW